MTSYFIIICHFLCLDFFVFILFTIFIYDRFFVIFAVESALRVHFCSSLKNIFLFFIIVSCLLNEVTLNVYPSICIVLRCTRRRYARSWTRSASRAALQPTWRRCRWLSPSDSRSCPPPARTTSPSCSPSQRRVYTPCLMVKSSDIDEEPQKINNSVPNGLSQRREPERHSQIKYLN